MYYFGIFFHFFYLVEGFPYGVEIYLVTYVIDFPLFPTVLLFFDKKILNKLLRLLHVQVIIDHPLKNPLPNLRIFHFQKRTRVTLCQLGLRQFFLNIYGNCIKYNRPGGKITTVMEAADVHDGICTYRWTISDTGIGMSPEFLSHIFDPFSQEKTDARSVYQGTGLGMAITKGLIEQMNGSIEVTSQVGVGSVFVITIPFEIAEKQKKDEEIAEKYNIRGLHLLAAEDNELNAEIIEMLCQGSCAEGKQRSSGKSP